jgi:hypothetical protein
MGLLSIAHGDQTAVISTEHSLTQQTGIGIYVLLVDTTNMLVGDTMFLRIKTKRLSTGVSTTAYKTEIIGEQTEPHKYSIPVPVDIEIICTLIQTTGTGRVFPWKLLRA